MSIDTYFCCSTFQKQYLILFSKTVIFLLFNLSKTAFNFNCQKQSKTFLSGDTTSQLGWYVLPYIIDTIAVLAAVYLLCRTIKVIFGDAVVWMEEISCHLLHISGSGHVGFQKKQAKFWGKTLLYSHSDVITTDKLLNSNSYVYFSFVFNIRS